ncbi:TPA: MFS transporter [Citrobacter freundii]
MSLDKTASETLQTDKPSRQRFHIVGMLFIGIMVAYLDRVNVSVFAADSDFLNYFGIAGNPVQIGLMMSIFLAAYGISGIVLSPIGDYLGPRKSMTICIITMAISMLIGGVSTTFIVFLVARVILGLAEGWYYPMQNLYVKNWIPPRERGRANATWVIGQSLAPAIAMPLFTWIIAEHGWRESFFFCAALSLIPLYLFWFRSTDKPEDHKKVNKEELQHIQNGLADERSNASQQTKLTFKERIKPFANNPKYWLLVLWYISLQVVYWGLVSWLPAYLRTAKGFSWAEMGWLASMPFVAAVLLKTVNGILNDKIGRSAPLLFLAMFLGGIFIFLASIVTGKYPAAFCMIFAFGFASMATSSAWTLLQTLIPASSLSSASGIMNGLSLGLSSLSPVFLGAIIHFTGSYDTGLFGLVAVCAIASVASGILVAKKC